MAQPQITSVQRARVLVCFAVREERNRFTAPALDQQKISVVTTGMGARNAARALAPLLEDDGPALVLTCGFAGALRPELAVGTVVFSEDAGAGVGEHLVKLGAIPATFHCAARVATTAAEKRLLRASSQADAVEMESGVIRRLCQERGIPSATVRAISDSADEDLPLNFNTVMNADDQIDFPKLIWRLVLSPSKLPGLLRLRQQTNRAALALGTTLRQLLGRERLLSR
jgi:adenosylhomocysteine nucleosidase